MIEHGPGEPENEGLPQAGGDAIGRREFLRRAAVLALGAAAAPLLAACEDAGPTPTLRARPATPIAQAEATATPLPPSPTAQPAVPATATPETIPSPTATATATEPPATQPPTSTSQATASEEAASSPPTSPPATATSPVASIPGPHGVALLATSDRATGVPAVLGMLGLAPGWLRGKQVALKANFNSADPPPGSTHLDTLRAILEVLKDWGATRITMLERSGMGDTRQVLRQRGVMDLAAKFGVNVVILDELAANGWVQFQGAHWKRGFLFPRLVQEADAVVQTCCLKTHRFGGHFTMSLKNSVGLVAKYDPGDGYNYMTELHNSASQRLMIAEVNAAYKPALVLLDGVLAFVNGGPDQGKRVEPGMLLAGRDRIAVDAAGVAMLRHWGTTPEVSRGGIFDQPQISHAAALGLGAPDASAMSLHPAADSASQQMAAMLQKLLAA